LRESFPKTCFLYGNGGVVLIEVMMAVVLMALLIVPLWAGVLSAVGAAEAVRDGTGGPGDAAGDPEAHDAWEWGPAVTNAWWEPGPLLYAQTELEGEVRCVVGLWTDGWFVGEWDTSGNGHIELAASVWSGLTGHEVTVRARREAGVWGTPWRVVVPMADGHAAVPESATDQDAACVVVHVPAHGNPKIGVSWADVSPNTDTIGLPITIPTPGLGIPEVGLDDRRQSWKTEATRDLDVYF
jgi:hypothetical protein